MQIKANTHLIEVFRTEAGAVYQCEASNNFILEFADRSTAFKPGNFIDFSKRLFAINLAEMLCSPAKHADLAIIMPPYCETCFLLTITEVISLQRILGGAKTILHLNSILRTSQLQFA
ncbi:hypothetical protein B0I27_1062 [Arcticibacter pallidicorallinus]|uniref:Uncharacterized protein n=1 Tax=Arcticibacter pallidicorallinus TaxID=1259464 RepID=A0A2T0U2V1_9SPHI|nr:hypothetical protein [Arcticibacter pallidicorallinus]PRY52244.1 hypothetical protein B0I27_1062 [Arcticibacter pallidicorallinus]